MRRATVAAVAVALLFTGCAHEPRFLAAWYVTSDGECGAPVTILLVNGGLKQTTIADIALNAPDGPRLDAGAASHLLAPGETLELHPSMDRPAGACGPVAAPSPSPPKEERHCLPIRLFVSDGSGRKRQQRVEIDRPMPTAYSGDAFLPCGHPSGKDR